MASVGIAALFSCEEPSSTPDCVALFACYDNCRSLDPLDLGYQRCLLRCGGTEAQRQAERNAATGRPQWAMENRLACLEGEE